MYMYQNIPGSFCTSSVKLSSFVWALPVPGAFVCHCVTVWLIESWREESEDLVNKALLSWKT